jgi:predicted transcriptional regulator
VRDVDGAADKGCEKKYDGGMNDSKMNAQKNLKFPALISAQFELSENEKRVLEAVQSFKMARNISDIAKKAELPRTTVDYIIKKLLRRKIVKKVQSRRRFYYLFNKLHQ